MLNSAEISYVRIQALQVTVELILQLITQNNFPEVGSVTIVRAVIVELSVLLARAWLELPMGLAGKNRLVL